MAIEALNALIFSINTVQEADDQVETVYDAVTGRVVYPSDVTIFDQMNLVETSGTLDFWNDPEEDIYDETDGNDV